MNTIYLSLGSNLGDRCALLQQAIRLLEQRVGIVEASSSFIETEPWGFESEHPFLNAAVRLCTQLTPFQLLLTTQQIEREMGRTRKSTPTTTVPSTATATSVPSNATATTVPDGFPSGPKYHDRPIDIDILIYNISKTEDQSNAIKQAPTEDQSIAIDHAPCESLRLSGIYAVDGQLLSLTLPHPLMHERDFVMIPLREVLE